MAIDLEQLNYTAGISTSQMNSGYGLGKQGGSKTWAETYDKIMNSKESISFYLVAAQEHLDEIVAKQFALKTGIENGIKEKNILKIIQPLSRENSNIYNQILNTLGVQSLEGIGDKIKNVGKSTWNFIKEAFRKIRLAIANIIQSIRKAIASVFNGGNASKYRERLSEIKSIVKGDVGKKTLKIPAVNKNRWLKVSDIEGLYKKLVTLAGNTGKDIGEEMNKFGGRLKKAAIVAGDYISNNKEKAAGTRYSYGKFGNQASSLFEKMAKTLGVDVSALTTKGNPVNYILYSGPTPKTFEIPIKVIIETSGAEFLIAQNAVQTLKALSNSLDIVIKGINQIIGQLEKYEKSMDVDKNAKSSNDKSIKKENLQFLSYLRELCTKLTMLSKEMFIQAIKLRKIYIRACSVALGEIDGSKNKKNNEEK